MKKIFKSIIFTVAAMVLGSCSLDLSPTDDVNAEDAFEVFSDAQRLANGMNTSFRSTLYGTLSYTQEVQGDMFNASPDNGNRNNYPHTMSSAFTTSDYSVEAYWMYYYNTIFNVNYFLANVDKVNENVKKNSTTGAGLTALQLARIEVWKGYAHFYRAYVYHQLVKYFAKDYEPGTAASTLGVPIPTEELEDKPLRSTLAETYKYITDDIEAAKTLMGGNAAVAQMNVAGAVRSIVPTLDAVKALEARVALSMHEYTLAAQLSSELMASTKYSLASDLSTMKKEWVNDEGPEDIMQSFSLLTENAGRANDIFTRWQAAYTAYWPDFLPTQTAIDMYDATDIRFKQWFKNDAYVIANGDYTVNNPSPSRVPCYIFFKYPGNPELYTSIPNSLHKPKVMRIAEMYLINAEANFKNGANAQALTALQTLQTARQATVVGSLPAGDPGFAIIMNEWAKETIGEGMRIDCFKRWHVGFSGRVPQYVNWVQTGNSFVGKVVEKDSHFFTLPIPAHELFVNKELRPQQNEGW